MTGALCGPSGPRRAPCRAPAGCCCSSCWRWSAWGSRSPGRSGSTTAARTRACSTPSKLSLAGVRLGQVGAVILGVLAVTGEYATGTITPTLDGGAAPVGGAGGKVAVVSRPGRWRRRWSASSVPCSSRAPVLPGRGFTAATGYPAVDRAARPHPAGGRRHRPLPRCSSPCSAPGSACWSGTPAARVTVVLTLLFVAPLRRHVRLRPPLAAPHPPVLADGRGAGHPVDPRPRGSTHRAVVGHGPVGRVHTDRSCCRRHRPARSRRDPPPRLSVTVDGPVGRGCHRRPLRRLRTGTRLKQHDGSDRDAPCTEEGHHHQDQGRDRARAPAASAGMPGWYPVWRSSRHRSGT